MVKEMLKNKLDSRFALTQELHHAAVLHLLRDTIAQQPDPEVAIDSFLDTWEDDARKAFSEMWENLPAPNLLKDYLSKHRDIGGTPLREELTREAIEADFEATLSQMKTELREQLRP